MKQLSADYLNSLNCHNRISYGKKVKLCFDIDPYEANMEEFDQDWDLFPNVSHGDIYHYLVHATNAVTNVQMKAYKSLQSHNYFTSGWVNPHIYHKVLKDKKHLLLGEVCLLHIYLY